MSSKFYRDANSNKMGGIIDDASNAIGRAVSGAESYIYDEAKSYIVDPAARYVAGQAKSAAVGAVKTVLPSEQTTNLIIVVSGIALLLLVLKR